MRYSIEARDLVKNFLIALKNLQQMQWKQHRKKQFKKQQKQLVIWLENKIADKIASVSKKKSAKELLNNDETKEGV